MRQNEGLHLGADGKLRCWWCGGDPLYQRYHDEEWGVPVRDEVKLYEKICLETFQSGLSWLTILRKRENFRAAFAGFNVMKVAAFDSRDVERLMHDKGIVRNLQKIEAAIANARAVCTMHEQGETLTDFFWSRLPSASERPEVVDYTAVLSLSETPTSKSISRELKQRGFKFIGPVTMYAHMQAMGIVNDHVEGCWRREAVQSSKPK